MYVKFMDVEPEGITAGLFGYEMTLDLHFLLVSRVVSELFHLDIFIE